MTASLPSHCVYRNHESEGVVWFSSWNRDCLSS